MGIAENIAALSQLSAANQVRFYKDSAKIDALLMGRFKELADDEDEDEAADEQGEPNSNEGTRDGNSNAGNQPAAGDGG